MYQLNPLFEISFETIAAAFDHRDKTRDAARGLDKYAYIKKLSKQNPSNLDDFFTKTSAIRMDANKPVLDRVKRMSHVDLLLTPDSKVMYKLQSTPQDRQRWIRQRKPMLPAKIDQNTQSLKSKTSKLKNKKLALGAAGIAGAGALGYGAYKYFKNKKKQD